MPLRYDEIQEVENIARSIAKQEIQRAARRDNLINAARDEPVKGPISPTGAGEGIPSDGGFLAKTGSKKIGGKNK